MFPANFGYQQADGIGRAIGLLADAEDARLLASTPWFRGCKACHFDANPITASIDIAWASRWCLRHE